MDEFKTLRVTLGNCEPPINESQGGSEPNTDWRPISPYCIQVSGRNNGMQGYRELQLYNTATSEGLGVTKPNAPSDPDYVPPFENLVACAIPPMLSVSPRTNTVGAELSYFPIDINSNVRWAVSADSWLTPSPFKRNYLLNSGVVVGPTGTQSMRTYNFSTNIPNGTRVTLSMKADLGKDYFGISVNGGNTYLTEFWPSDETNGVFSKTFTWSVGNTSNLTVYQYGGSGSSSIDWIMLTPSNVVTDGETTVGPTSSQSIKVYLLDRPIQNGTLVTIEMDADLGKDYFAVYTNHGNNYLGEFWPAHQTDGVFRRTFTWNGGNVPNITLYQYGGSGSSTINYFRLRPHDTSDWITAPEDSTVQGSGNAKLNVRVEPNSGDQRTGALTVLGGGLSESISINQGAAAAKYLDVSISSRSVGYGQSTFTFNISSNVSWTISDDSPWINPTVTSGSGDAQITVIVDNNSGGQRNGTISVDGDGVPNKNISVTQQAIPTYIISLYGRGAMMEDFEGANTPDEAMLNAVQRTIYATDVVGEIGIGTRFYMDSSLTSTVPGNARWYRLGNTTIAIQIGNGGYYLDMVDTSISLEVSPATLNVGSGAVFRSVTVTSTAPWQVHNKPSWVTNINPDSGNGNASIVVSIEANTGGSPRSGSVTLRTVPYTRSAQIQITQQGFAVVTPSEYSMPKAGGSFTITVNTSGAWSVRTPLENGISIPANQLSGSGNGTINVSVSANPFDNFRLIPIEISIGGVWHMVTVNQAG